MNPKDEMIEGYLDGLDLNSPTPSANRTRSYRHGFANGRSDRRGEPFALASTLRRMAQEAINADVEDYR